MTLCGVNEPLLDPKKLQNQQFYIIDWIRKKLLVDVANLATCCHDDYDVLLEVWGTLGKCYVSNPVAKTVVWIENHDWHNCFWMSSWGSPVLDPKKLQNQQFYIIDWIRKKLLVDVANLATCCHDDDDVLLEVLGTLGKCYVSNPVAKTVVWIWGSPLLDPKKLQNQQFYKIDWIRKKLLVDVANLATYCHYDDWMCLEPYIGGKADERAHKRTLTKQFPIEPTWCFTRAKLAPKCPCHTMRSQRQVSWISAPKPKH